MTSTEEQKQERPLQFRPRRMPLEEAENSGSEVEGPKGVFTPATQYTTVSVPPQRPKKKPTPPESLCSGSPSAVRNLQQQFEELHATEESVSDLAVIFAGLATRED